MMEMVGAINLLLKKGIITSDELKAQRRAIIENYPGLANIKECQ